jgi:hypothetical protein
MISLRLLWRASSAEEDAHDIHVHVVVVDVRVVFFLKIQITTYVGSNIDQFLSLRDPTQTSGRLSVRGRLWAPSGGLMAWVCLSSIR